MNYTYLKKFLFTLSPELSHDLTLKLLKLVYTLTLTKKLFPTIPTSPKKIMGLTFNNPIGLAAGLDKNGDYIDALASLGFGFIEVGTITPKPQPGNPKPRLFRLEKEAAIINRMGFNNKGVAHLVSKLQKIKYQGVLGINIGKNSDTPLEKAIADYVYTFNAVAEYASYVTINISSPNTQGLRDLQHGELLQNLLRALKHEQSLQKKYVPLVVKISPDLTDDELKNLSEVLLAEKIDGVIATNTTVSRDGVSNSGFAGEAGGLSGKPLCARSTMIVKKLHALLQNQIPIIASGGVMDAESAAEKIAAGASLIQIYSGLIYQGPLLIKLLLQK